MSQQEGNKRSAEQKGWLGEGESVAGSVSTVFSSDTTQLTRKRLQVQGQWETLENKKRQLIGHPWKAVLVEMRWEGSFHTKKQDCYKATGQL